MDHGIKRWRAAPVMPLGRAAENVDLLLDADDVRELLKSAGIEAECMSYAQKVQQAAGDGYVAEARHYPERSGAAVYPGTDEAHKDNLDNNTLEKAIRSL